MQLRPAASPDYGCFRAFASRSLCQLYTLADCSCSAWILTNGTFRVHRFSSACPELLQLEDFSTRLVRVAWYQVTTDAVCIGIEINRGSTLPVDSPTNRPSWRKYSLRHAGVKDVPFSFFFVTLSSDREVFLIISLIEMKLFHRTLKLVRRSFLFQHVAPVT